MCINSDIFKSRKKCLGEKKLKCSESSEMPRKVFFRHFQKNAYYAYFMHNYAYFEFSGIFTIFLGPTPTTSERN